MIGVKSSPRHKDNISHCMYDHLYSPQVQLANSLCFNVAKFRATEFLEDFSAARPLFSAVSNNFSSSLDRHASVVDCRGLSMVIGTFQESFRCGPFVARGDQLWRRRWSGGPSVAAILGPGDHPWQQKLPQMVRGDRFWGDHRWRDRPHRVAYSVRSSRFCNTFCKMHPLLTQLSFEQL